MTIEELMSEFVVLYLMAFVLGLSILHILFDV
jgi:hypothetical protein